MSKQYLLRRNIRIGSTDRVFASGKYSELEVINAIKQTPEYKADSTLLVEVPSLEAPVKPVVVGEEKNVKGKSS